MIATMTNDLKKLTLRAWAQFLWALIEKPLEAFIVAILCVALPALLAYSGKHTADLLASYANPHWLGYLAAFGGIEPLIIAISLKIGKEMRLAYSHYKDTKEIALEHVAPVFLQTAVLCLVTFISMYANLIMGYHVRYELDMIVPRIALVDPIQGLGGVLATALIPILTLSVSEIIASLARDFALATPDVTPDATPAPKSNVIHIHKCANENEKCKGDLRQCPDCDAWLCATHAPTHSRHAHPKTA